MVSCPKCGAPCLDTHRYCPACGADLSNTKAKSQKESLIGTTIARKFVLRELIGSGGMGKVFRADQKGVGRTVAVKIMHRHLLGDETAAARFTNEARASSSLNHPHSIAVLDFGQTEVGMLYIVMEYLRGCSLDELLRTAFPIPFGRVAKLLCQALDAVEAAHRQAIIHRDLKPENIFLLDHHGQRDFVKVLDFGIAKMLDHEDRSVTTPGLVPGTPEYMSPEQARGEKLDPRSDVYSMGVILYELLTGVVPFRGSSAVATMMSHVQDPVPPPSQRRPELQVPASLESIVLWALAKSPNDRISSAAQFRDVLAAWANVAGVWTARESRPEAASLFDILSADQVSEIANEVQAEEPEIEDVPEVALAPSVSAGNGLVDRQADLARLHAFVDDRGPRSLVLRSSPGLGKTRLLDDLVAYARDKGYDVLRCAPELGWVPELLALAHAVALHCLGAASDDPAGILQSIGTLGLDAEEVPGIEELFHLPTHLSELDPESRRRERASAFRQLVYKRAEQRKLLLVFEQFDRWDAPSRELARSIVDVPRQQLAVLVSQDARDADDWGPKVQRYQLEPLTPEQSAQMAQQMFDDAVPADIVQRIADLSRGQPLFIQQLAYAAAHEGITDPPDRLGDLIAARAQRLPQEERSLLQWMAVSNAEVSANTLSRLCGRAVSHEQLAALAARGLLRAGRIRGGGPSRRPYGFAHHMVGMVVYSSIPAEVRREMHQAVAEHLRQTDAPVTTVAYHAYEADDGPRAVEELDRAGVWSTRCLDPHGAIRYYTNALDLVRREWGRGRVAAVELDQMAVDLALRLAEVLRQTDDPLTTEGVLGEALSVAAGHDSERARLRLELGRLDLERGNLQRAIRHLQLARSDAQAAKSPWLLGEITRELARAQGLMGERGEAGQLLFSAIEESTRASGQHRGPSWSTLLGAAATSAQIGFPERAQGYLLDALQQAENDRSLQGKLQVVTKMASLHQASGEWAEAELRITQGLDLVSQIGDRTRRAELLLSLGRLRRISGDVEGAREYLDDALRICRRLDWAEGVMMVEQESEMLRFAVPQSL